jgi:rare lipoprotein A
MVSPHPPANGATGFGRPATERDSGMTLLAKTALLLALSLGLSACVHETTDAQDDVETTGSVISGTASWYGPRFHGRRTANGERYDMHQLTAAHKTLPFNTRVQVTNVRTGKTVVVRINDRGPYAGRRIIDLSRGAAERVGMIASGTAPVKVEILKPRKPLKPVKAAASG